MLLSKLKTYSDINAKDVIAWNNLLLLIENEHLKKGVFTDNILCLLLKVLALKYHILDQDIQSLTPIKNREEELVNNFIDLIN